MIVTFQNLLSRRDAAPIKNPASLRKLKQPILPVLALGDHNEPANPLTKTVSIATPSERRLPARASRKRRRAIGGRLTDPHLEAGARIVRGKSPLTKGPPGEGFG